jgi:hypothetical protein
MSQIVKYTGGGAIAPALAGKVKAFDSAPEMLTSFQGYYGFQIQRVCSPMRQSWC